MERKELEEYLKPTEKNFEWARQAFNNLTGKTKGNRRSDKKWTHEKIIDEVKKHHKKSFPEWEGKLEPTQFSKFMNHEKHQKNTYGSVINNFECFARFIYDNKIDKGYMLSEEKRDRKTALYHEFRKFLGIQRGTEDRMSERSEGLYRVYRRSTVLRNKVIMGASRIKYDELSDAVIVTEKFRYKPEKVQNNTLGFRGMEEDYSGWLSKSDNKYILFLKDLNGSSLQITIFTHKTRTKDQINTMKGIALGVLGDDLYSLPIYYERFDGEEKDLEALLDIYEQNMIPEVVLSHIMSRADTD